jgi:leucyl/phenylalanyl-tRNA--protein transferase
MRPQVQSHCSLEVALKAASRGAPARQCRPAAITPVHCANRGRVAFSRQMDELSSRFRFPHPDTADQDGFLAVGGDLKPGTLLLAYRNGIFPWTTNPITWWSPDPRAVIEPAEIHISESMGRFLRKGTSTVTFDRAFTRVMEGCAVSRAGREETWISPRFIAAYTRLFQVGYAHSVEVWKGDDLVGGLYGVSIGGFFAGESMFSAAPNASKQALIALCGRLEVKGFLLFDVQLMTPHLRSMGAREISRREYLVRLRHAVDAERSFA